MKLPKQFFVTGTDTDVGKTHVCLELVRTLVEQGRSVGVMKPIAAGAHLHDGVLVNSDALSLIEASGCGQNYEEVNPYLFEEPISPHIAAKNAGVEIDLDVLVQQYQRIKSSYDSVVVEGAGGWMTPLSDSTTLADLVKRLQIPVVLVVGLKLGCLNHAQLTQVAIKRSGLLMAGWIANTLDPQMPQLQENIEYLKKCMEAPLLAHISYKKH
jgi:dethiobiotin synthetase